MGKSSTAPCRFWIGTSGYSYPEWRGSFYPEKLAASKMLPFYAERFTTVEINATFYRAPTAKLLEGWAAQVPPEFRFTLKAPKRITHDARLKECEQLVRYFCDTARSLGDRLGVLLFQLPPNFRRDLGVLASFLEFLPNELRVAFEFRHESWLDDELFGLLQGRNIALCVADGEKVRTPPRCTATHAYFRLRDEGYTGEEISRWAGIVRETSRDCADAFVYFKHEEQGKGPEFGERLRECLA